MDSAWTGSIPAGYKHSLHQAVCSSMAMGLIWAPGLGSLCIHSFIPQISFITYYVPDVVLGTGNMTASTNNHSPCPMEFSFHTHTHTHTQNKRGSAQSWTEAWVTTIYTLWRSQGKVKYDGQSSKGQNSLGSRGKDLRKWPWYQKK